MLAERFATPVEPFDPFKRVTFDSKKFQVDALADVAPTAAVAVGLALRRVNDR
jgi:type IV pilus assembly protein PilM